MVVSRPCASVLRGVIYVAIVGVLATAAPGQATSPPAGTPQRVPERSTSVPAPEQPVKEPEKPPAEAPQPDAAKPVTPAAYDILTTKQLTGDWFGARTKLQNAGITFEPLLSMEYQHNTHGGANTHAAHDLAGLALYNLELDFGKMNLVPGGSFFARGLQSWDTGIRTDVGSLAHPGVVVSSQGDREIELQKWWWRQRLFDDRLEFRLGKLYTGDLMDCVEYAGNPIGKFMNQALFRNMTMPNTIGLGAYTKVWPTNWLYLSGLVADSDTNPSIHRRGLAGFDSAFHGQEHYYSYWETGFLPAQLPGAQGWLPGHYAVGGWYDPRPKTIFMSNPGGVLPVRRDNDDVGLYANMDQMVWKENATPADKQGLGLFARYGFSPKETNLICQYWSTGAEYLGLIPSRNNDTLGFGVAQSMLSEQHRLYVNSLDDRETVYELYYAIKLTPWCTITPDLQMITNPGGLKSGRDSLVAGVRVTISF